MDSVPSLSARDTVFANLRMILRGLLGALGAWRLEPVMAIALYRRTSRTIGRVERMLARFRAGKLRLVKQQQRASPKPRQRGCVAVRGPALPRRFGWLVIAAGHHAACYGSQLQTVLNTPEMGELLAASTQARRILRPLCRALALELPWVVPAPRKISPRRVRPRVKPEPFRIPLPRGLLSAARRQGFGKMC